MIASKWSYNGGGGTLSQQPGCIVVGGVGMFFFIPN